jgi:beta-barrel assembly-enhancing protease
MSHQTSSFFWSVRKGLFYSLLSIVTALTVSVASPQVTYAIPWMDILLQGVQVFQLSTMSDQDEVSLGGQINQQVARQYPLSSNRQLTQYINEIGQKLAKNSTRPNIPYTFQVVNDKNINAFATMGGYVYVNTGLIATASNEAELAGVIGHEIGHIVGRHSLKQMKEQAIAQGVVTAAGLDRNTAVQLGLQVGFKLPRSRSDELQADQLGLANLTKAGYAPIGMVTFFEKLQKANSGSAPPSFLSTHPATGDRISRLQESMNQATAKKGAGLDSTAYKAKIKQLGVNN